MSHANNHDILSTKRAECWNLRVLVIDQPQPREIISSHAKRILRQHLPEIRERYQVKSLGIFGSYIRGEQKKRSDLDLLVEFESYPSLFEFVHLQNELSKLVGIKVDLVTKSGLKPAIGRRILAEVVTL